MELGGKRGNGSERFYTFGPDTPEPEPVERKGVGMKKDLETDCDEEVAEAESSMKKRLQWKWWLITAVVALVGAGFAVSQHLTGSYVRRDDYQRAQVEHRTTHEKITSKMIDIEKSLTGVRIEQAQQTERSKLIDARLELLIQRSNEGPENRREERDLRDTIELQEQRLKRLENDPRVKRLLSDDPLSDLSSQ